MTDWHSVIAKEEARVEETETHMEDWPSNRRTPWDEVIIGQICPFDPVRVDTFINYHTNLNR